eukprot:scaffold3525_cov104-Skeletonema_marinoi.AAC.1
MGEKCREGKGMPILHTSNNSAAGDVEQFSTKKMGCWSCCEEFFFLFHHGIAWLASRLHATDAN